MKIRGLILIASIIMGLFIGYSSHNLINRDNHEQNVVLLPEHPFYLLEDVNEEVLYKTLKHYDFPNPAIITAQAILESGNFKSRLCLENYNLFGLYNSNKMEYFKFDSWISCVFAYRKYILNKYKEGEDYYGFLQRINYAEDPNYISKVKTLENKIIKKYETKERSTSLSRGD